MRCRGDRAIVLNLNSMYSLEWLKMTNTEGVQQSSDVIPNIGPDIEKLMGTGLQIYANLVVTTLHYYAKYDNFIEIHVELQIYGN